MTDEERAIGYFEMYTKLTYDATDLRHKAVVADMAKCLSNMSDNLGLQSISLNGINEANMSLFPDFIMRAMDRLAKKVKFR